jgi:mycobactin lysine-N-oxygenase
VVDATGFDPWAFTHLLSSDCRAHIGANQQEMIRSMGDDLSLALPRWPRLHVPGLSETVGPGYGSLMVLGAMADRILAPYHAASTA